MNKAFAVFILMLWLWMGPAVLEVAPVFGQSPLMATIALSQPVEGGAGYVVDINWARAGLHNALQTAYPNLQVDALPPKEYKALVIKYAQARMVFRATEATGVEVPGQLAEGAVDLGEQQAHIRFVLNQLPAAPAKSAAPAASAGPVGSVGWEALTVVLAVGKENKGHINRLTLKGIGTVPIGQPVVFLFEKANAYMETLYFGPQGTVSLLAPQSPGPPTWWGLSQKQWTYLLTTLFTGLILLQIRRKYYLNTANHPQRRIRRRFE